MLWTDKTEKKVGLTLKAPTVAGEPYNPEEMTIGTAIVEAQVLHQEKSSSLLLDLKNGHLGFAPVSVILGIANHIIYMCLYVLYVPLAVLSS